MHLIRLSLLSMLVACGDDVSPAIDAPIHHDDGPPDAPPDAPPGPNASRIWGVGNIVATRQAGAFTDGATLPFGNGTATPILIPSGAATLASAAGYSTQIFDVNKTGTTTAFVADIQVAGRFDLYVGNSIGGSPTMVVQGGTGLEIAAVALSPDGTKVAYTIDSVLENDGQDLYWIATTAGTAHKVSPARPIGAINKAVLDVSPQFYWSSDSRYIAFTGDLTEDTFNQAYCADTSTTNLAAELLARADIPGTSLLQGAFGPLGFDAAKNVYFLARLSTTAAGIQLYRVKPDGTMRTDITSLAPLRGDSSTPDMAAFGITADGLRLVFATDTPTADHYDLFINTIGTTTATNISAFPADWIANSLLAFAFSPDGTKVAVIGKTPGGVGRPSQDPYVVTLAGSGTRRLAVVSAACTGCASPDAIQVEWTLDSTVIYVRGDITTNNVSKVYRLRADMTDQTPTLAYDTSNVADVQQLIVRPPL